jgi:hypothetical protein
MTRKLLLIVPGLILLLIIVVTLPLYAIHQRNAKTILNLTRMLEDGEIALISAEQMERFEDIQEGVQAEMGFLDDELDALRAAYRERLSEALDAPEPPDRRRMDRLRTFRSFSKALPSIDARSWWEGDLEEALEAELAYVGSWQEHNIEMRVTRDLRGRLVIIRSALKTHPHARKGSSGFFLRSRRYLMRQTIETVTGMTANPDTDALLVDLLPTVADFDAVRIPLILIHNRLREEESRPGVDRRRWRTIREGLEKIRRRAAERSFIMERVINEMLEGLDAGEQRGLLRHGLDVLREHYLFDPAGRAWPEGMAPLTAVLAARVEDHHGPSGRVVRGLCRGPLYLAELESIQAVTAVRFYETLLLTTLKHILDQMADDRWREIDMEQLDALQLRIDVMMPPDKPHLKPWRDFFARQRADLLWLKPLVKRWIYANLPADRAVVLEKLKAHFAQMCEKAGRLNEVPCVVAH